MGNSKKKRKSTREPQLSANSRAASKRDKQDVVHRMVMTSIEREKRGNVYRNVEKLSLMPLLLAHGLQRTA